MKILLNKSKIAIIGLGYVGLPLAVEFGKKYSVVGFDVNSKRIEQLKNGFDSTLEVESSELKKSELLNFTDSTDDIAKCNIFVVTVPTPIDQNKCPDLTALKKASEMIGKVLKEGDVVIYESTVYPGCTEEECTPILEKYSGLQHLNVKNMHQVNAGFYIGYSPERINPGDKLHRLTNIKKVTSGSTPESAEFIDNLYSSVVIAGTHKASSIKVAEAAKVIENTQRDVNIALINELAILFNKLGIDTQQVLEAAETKWNFLPFSPGLVGGHCIGVDPYYLTHKAQSIGYTPEIILAGRRLNDNMGSHIVSQLLDSMNEKKIKVDGSRVLVMGLAFKENCPDIRNTRVIDIIKELARLNVTVDVHDPWVNIDEAKNEYGIELIEKPKSGMYDAVIIAVSHLQFADLGSEAIKKYGKKTHILYDVKYLLKPNESDLRL
jgi:UDP-N-acetyl-D-glucosamine/UDP-N-acetyl-D-galactosamine dehydrogenase